MFSTYSWLDIVLVLVLIWQLIYGWQAGFLVALSSAVGFALGGVAAFFVAPMVNSWAGNGSWRLTIVVATAIALVLVGYFLGAAVGRKLSSGVRPKPLRAINRVLGAAVSLVITALIISPVAFSLSALGVPGLSQAIAQSSIVRGVDQYTPEPVQQGIAQLRSQVLDERIPQLFEKLGPSDVAPPANLQGSQQQKAAAESVMRITGTAFQCGQNQTGTGFVVAPNKVLTNAHVVAGVDKPIVETRNGSLNGTVVYFDPTADIAVLSVPGLNQAPLQAGTNLNVGEDAMFDGYPHGGPFQSKPASVTYRGETMLKDIYGGGQHDGEVYQLAADVQPGNSGGPLLNAQGKVVGLIFAKAADSNKVGYAFTMAEVQPVINQAASFSDQVSAGRCTKE